MRIVLILLVLISQGATAQTIALIDRNFKNQVLLTQQLTRKQLSGKNFPIYATDVNAIIQLADSLLKRIVAGGTQKPNMKLLPTGHSQFSVMTNYVAHSATYSVYLTTRIADLGAAIELVKKGDTSKRAAQRLQLFLDYLKNNRHLIPEN